MLGLIQQEKNGTCESFATYPRGSPPHQQSVRHCCQGDEPRIDDELVRAFCRGLKRLSGSRMRGSRVANLARIVDQPMRHLNPGNVAPDDGAIHSSERKNDFRAMSVHCSRVLRFHRLFVV